MTWWWQLERRMIDTLLRSPSFQRGVQKVHSKVHQIQHGKPPEYNLGGTHLDEPEAKQGLKKFFQLFWEELKTGHKSDPKNKK